MKETYFTPENIETVAGGMIAELPASYTSRTLPPLARSALLVLDMQKYFLNRRSHAFIPSAPALLAGLNRLIETFAGAGRPVLFTRHINNRENAGLMDRWWRDLIRDGDELARLSDKLLVPPGGRMIEKSQYDAFHGTALESTLAGGQVDTVVVTGVMTHLCCETTARSAFTRGFRVIVPADGTATYTAGHHRASLLNLSHGFAFISTAGRILEHLEEG